METFFPDTSENFHMQRITRPVIGKLTDGQDRIEGDDDGYRLHPIQESEESMVDLAEACDELVLRPAYDGFDEYGNPKNSENELPGGLDGKMYGRESMAATLNNINAYLAETYGPNVQLVVVDAFRSKERQTAAYTRNAILVHDTDTSLPTSRVGKIYQAGLIGDGTVSWVHPKRDSKQYKALEQAIIHDPNTFAELKAIAEKKAIEQRKKLEDVLPGVIDDYIIILANVYDARKHFAKIPDIGITEGIPLNIAPNAHTGGGGMDVFLMVDGKPCSPVPFDFVGEAAAIDFTEDDANFDRYKQMVAESDILQKHLQNLGIDPANVTYKHWNMWKEGNRILHWTMKRTGASYYSAPNPKDGGENWHKNGVNVVKDVRTGEIIFRGGLHEVLPGVGNTCDAIQKSALARVGVIIPAVYGGIFAHEQLGLSYE